MRMQRIREIKRSVPQPVDPGPKITITARQALDRGWWLDVCRMTGIDEWAVNEGRMSDGSTIELTESQYRSLIGH